MKTVSYFALFCVGVLLCNCTAKTSSNADDIQSPIGKKEPATHTPKVKTTLNIEDCLVKTSDKKLEIVTWNVEHFPKKAEATIKELAGLIQKMDVDVLALQEIKSKKALDKLLEYLPDYEKCIMDRGDINLAFLYKTTEISLTENPYAILKNKRALPRSPYVLPIHSKSTGLDVLVINNHYKATTFRDNAKKKADNERRRKESSRLIKNWIDTNHPTDNVVVCGDLNDAITDPRNENVFQVFLDDSKNYRFADSEIAKEENKKMWSHPKTSKYPPIHFDHILITNELFDNQDAVYTYTFYQTCDKKYDALISDHQPVCLVLKK